ncbi:four helix bundle protein [Candidatus Woesearchaeota archaeon]|nr:four helix bundle protein [Candidatus Woesearchaeota archaeon]
MVYNLEIRTFEFAKRIRAFVNQLPKTIATIEDGKQVVRSSGSVGANYIEANESLGKKDFVMRLKISRKEAKESKYWLELIEVGNNDFLATEKVNLVKEAEELQKILSSIIGKISFPNETKF